MSCVNAGCAASPFADNACSLCWKHFTDCVQTSDSRELDWRWYLCHGSFAAYPFCFPFPPSYIHPMCHSPLFPRTLICSESQWCPQYPNHGVWRPASILQQGIRQGAHLPQLHDTSPDECFAKPQPENAPATVTACPTAGMTSSTVTLWQFLMELLLGNRHHDAIRWISTDGEFKLVNAEKVARLWGERKDNPTMTYDKMSRAMRHYYSKGILSKVAGKNYVYKFHFGLKLPSASSSSMTTIQASTGVTMGEPLSASLQSSVKVYLDIPTELLSTSLDRPLPQGQGDAALDLTFRKGPTRSHSLCQTAPGSTPTAASGTEKENTVSSHLQRLSRKDERRNNRKGLRENNTSFLDGSTSPKREHNGKDGPFQAEKENECHATKRSSNGVLRKDGEHGLRDCTEEKWTENPPKRHRRCKLLQT